MRTEVTFDREAIFHMSGEAFRIYMWMNTYLPDYGYEMSYRELAEILGSSPTTLRKHIDWLVASGWIERIALAGITATYRVIK